MKKGNSKALFRLGPVLFLLTGGFLLTRCVTLRDKETQTEMQSTPGTSAVKVTATNSKNDNWKLWTGGTKLRGANVWQKRIEPNLDGDGFGPGKVGPPYGDADVKALADLGANWLNLSFPGVFTENSPYQLDPAVEKELEEWFVKAERHKLYVTLSFRTGPGRNEAIFDDSEKLRANQSVWSDPQAQDAWVTMWKHVAKKFGNQPNLAGFHLMVEPNGNRTLSPPVESAAAFYKKYKGKTQDWNPLAVRLIQAIRSENKTVPILVGGLNFSDLEWAKALELPQDPYLVTNVHFYEPYQYSHKELNMAYPANKANPDGETWNKAWLKTRLADVEEVRKKKRTPVSIGEFGVFRHQTGAPKYLDEVTDLFEEYGVNYSVWLWESSFKKIDYDQFNFRRGTKEANHTDVNNNELVQVLKKRWAKNTVRP